MRTHDGTADRQTEPGATGLRGKERIEQLGRRDGSYADTAIRDHELDIALGIELRAQDDLALCFGNLLHGIDTVAHQVQHDLLDLHGVSLDVGRG